MPGDNHMKIDTEIPFQDLYTANTNFKSHLLALQGCINDRHNYHRWARQLRFVAAVEDDMSTVVPALFLHDNTSDREGEDDKSLHSSETSIRTAADGEECTCNEWPSFAKHTGAQNLRLTPPAGCPDCSHYVAVSWCWKTTGESADQYHMIGDVSRPSKTPSIILDRAIAFAASKDQPFIWIDKECINQDDRNDQEAGIQSMDLVYQRSFWPLGLLNAYFDKQSHLDIWGFLINGEPIGTDRMLDLVEVLQKLSEDKWFTRAWILQESVSSGFQMSLLARHAPGLTKSIYLGEIDDEIELTIESLHSGLVWAEQCVDDAEGEIEAELADKIKHLTSSIWNFNPTHIAGYGPEHKDPRLGAREIDAMYQNPDFRQTCNAAQALSFLRPRLNSRVPDRLAIMANLCNYSVRLDTNKVVELSDPPQCLQFGFSICAFALALFNGDLSLILPKGESGSDTGDHLDFCWGPSRVCRLDAVQYYEDDEIIVRAAAPKLLQSGGLVLSGWLWELRVDALVSLPLTEALVRDTQNPPTPSVLWSIFRDLMQQDHVQLADVLWDNLSKAYFGHYDEFTRRNTPRIPGTVRDVLEVGTGKLIYYVRGWVEKEEDYTAFFPGKSSPAVEWFWRDVSNYKSSEWFWRSVMSTGKIRAAELMDGSSGNTKSKAPVVSSNDNHLNVCPTAVFDLQGTDPSMTTYVFTPSTVLDSSLSRSTRRTGPLSWIVELETTRDSKADRSNTVLRGIRTCRGYWKIPSGKAVPREYTLF